MTQNHPAVFGGVDTHKHTHVAAALDGAGRVLGSAAFDADTAGYTALLGWLGGHGSVERVGVEGTGSYGAGLARHLAAAGADAPRARPAARSCAASSATSHARSTGCSPTRPQCPKAPTCADSAPNKGSPSTRQPKPSEPHAPKSQNSKEASATTANSPNATSDTSPRTRLDGT